MLRRNPPSLPSLHSHIFLPFANHPISLGEMGSLTLTFTFGWLYLTQGQWARILTWINVLFSLIYCLRVYFIWLTFVLWICHIQSTSFEILFWLKPYFKLINYKYQQREWVEREGEQHVLQMTPCARLPPQRQLIPSLTYHGEERGIPPQLHT